MSFIAFELDALNVCPQVGAACGLSAAQASHGLLQMWAYCFRAEKATVSDLHLRGFFEGRDAGPALEAFGFVEKTEGWRVRGAERYLRVKAAQREGGRKSAANLRRGHKKAGKPPRAGHPAGTQPEVHPEVHLKSTSGASPALTPNTEHRTPNTEVEKMAGDERPPPKSPATPKPKTDARHAPLVQALEEACLGYAFSGRDAKPLSALLKKHGPEEVLVRFRRAWARTGYPTVRSVHELEALWGHFATDSPGVAQRQAPTEYPNGYVKL